MAIDLQVMDVFKVKHEIECMGTRCVPANITSSSSGRTGGGQGQGRHENWYFVVMTNGGGELFDRCLRSSEEEARRWMGQLLRGVAL